MSTAVIWSKSKPDVEFQYGGPLGEFSGMSSQSHVSQCRGLPLGEFTVMIPEPRATLQGVRFQSAILKIVFHHIFFVFKNVVSALTNGGFRIVSDTLVIRDLKSRLHLFSDKNSINDLEDRSRTSTLRWYNSICHTSLSISGKAKWIYTAPSRKTSKALRHGSHSF